MLLYSQVVLVDCTPLHDRMVPRLNDIYKDIIEFVAENSNKLANEFIGDMQQIIKVWTISSTLSCSRETMNIHQSM